jgi:hypothetical protein
MTARPVESVQLDIPLPPHGRCGLLPEYLANDRAAAPKGDDVATFWFKLTVPASAPAGNVSTVVTLTAGEGERAIVLSFTVNVQVAAAALAVPIQPSIDVYLHSVQYICRAYCSIYP